MLLPRFMLRPLLPVLGGLTARRLLKYSYYDQSLLTEEVRDEYIRPTRLKGSLDGLMAMMQQARIDEPFDYSRITMPALLRRRPRAPYAP
jgi:hypothetical protein